jgi:ATPase family protein associated with various cellular activities (AAA)
MASVLDLAEDGRHPGLAAEIARIAERFAEVVGGLTGTGSEALAEIEAFLRSTADEARRRPEDLSDAAPLDRVATALRFAPVEIDLLLLAGLADEHEGYASAFRHINAAGDPHPTLGLAARLFCVGTGERDELRAVLERGAAVGSGALAVDNSGPFFERSLYVGDGLWHALHGIDVWPTAVELRREPAVTEGLEEWLAEPAAASAAGAIARRAPVTVVVMAESETIAVGRASALAAHAGVPAAAINVPTSAESRLIRLLGAHALARDCVPLLRFVGGEPQAESVVPNLGEHPGPVVVCARPGATAHDGLRPVLSVSAVPLSADSRRRMWRALLPELAADAPLLAARHLVEPATAAEAAADVRALRTLSGRSGSAADVLASIRARAGVSLSAGAKLVRATATWDRLVLRPDRLAQLREALERLLHQSRVLDEWGFLEGRPGARGVRMLFAGPPGTGKTLSAEVLAHELGVDLLVVDISRVVSKWIGETEKNLAEVFDAAERAQAVLLFDEADALFGKRTEISDAHDRYANLETAYLLARLERFEGLAVLATNLRQNVDPAFIRRLEFVVDFEEPAAPERKALWRCHLPERAPLAADVDLGHLAALYPVVGGVIRNAATAAGFLAASEGVPIARAHLGRALRREYEKAGKAFPGEPTADPAGRNHG